MKAAIVTGATGFIGSALVKELLLRGIKVLALGRKDYNEISINSFKNNQYLTYLKIDMSNISELKTLIEKISWSVGNECVFYNFAWGGVDRLSDLDIEAQMNNVTWTYNAIQICSEIGCIKFIHVGTMEEAFTKKYLSLDFKINNEYNRHVVYSVAKMASRNLLKMRAKILGIDLIIATNSHVMGPGDDKDSFLQVTLQKMVMGDELIFSTGEQIFDVISINDCANAYVAIGEKGVGFSEYWIGSGNPRPLKEYVESIYSLYPSKQKMQFGKFPYNDISLTKNDFDIKSLTQDTGFIPKQTFEETVIELHHSLFNV